MVTSRVGRTVSKADDDERRLQRLESATRRMSSDIGSAAEVIAKLKQGYHFFGPPGGTARVGVSGVRA